MYSGAVHPSDETYYGGTQDNGTIKSATVPTWITVFSGDGGVTAVDYRLPTMVYTEYVYLCIQRSTNAGASWARTMGTPPNNIPTSGPSQSDGTSDRCAFIAPYVMAPSNPDTMVAGTYKVYLTTNGGATWSSISNDLTGSGVSGVGSVGSVISAIAIAKSSASTFYVEIGRASCRERV